jgi:hypothetical protein
MRRWISGAALLLLASAHLSAQDSRPTIVFDSQAHDFGKAIQGEELKHLFKFTNRGSAPLEIFKVEGS